ncbi:hypothetical protein PTSG_02283 [Salpingoeca rosetta]|uniref:Uncharacterized protein n=1 Tax=Salpingoeca rosetta (strain ATCC 50818 / BSB-021) TaxID=946362 RepID=F2U1R6_SALR5|nr:uncharacterized protein PTSG_02283 [Salpingoeca rosetta]EGD81568.1 hypothetical protein PTSG_02283 [Salpingoeca rosetta]|eukprot:XP_004996772.1 hypothetical protein PTSG_02283 [Salpingoeca rosetta]
MDFWTRLGELAESIAMSPEASAVLNKADVLEKAKSKGSKRATRSSKKRAQEAAATITFHTIRQRVADEEYTKIEEFERDINTICSQAATQQPADNKSRVQAAEALRARATRIIDSARPMLMQLQQRDVEKTEGLSLAPNVELKYVRGSDPESRFNLPMYNPSQDDALSARLATWLTPFRAVRPMTHVEKSWNHALPATNLARNPWISFGPTDDGTQANVGDYEADILLNHRQPWHPPPSPHGLSTVNFARAVMRSVSLMGSDRHQLASEAESVLNAAEQDPELQALLTSILEEDDDDAQEASSAPSQPPKEVDPLTTVPDHALKCTDPAPTADIVKRNHELLSRMQAEQVARVSTGRPWEIGPREIQLANHLRHNLKIVIARRTPKQVTDISAVRSLAGVQARTRPPSGKRRAYAAKAFIEQHAKRAATAEEEKSLDVHDSEAEEEAKTDAQGQAAESDREADAAAGEQSARDTSAKATAAATDSTTTADEAADPTRGTATPKMIQCERCGGLGLQFHRPVLHGIPELLCQACGEHWEQYRLPRLVQFDPDSECTIKLQAKPYLFRTK